MSTRHPSTDALLSLFCYSHLPPHLQEISAPFAALALRIANGPSNAETTVALRKLREAKDCAVTAQLTAKVGPFHFEPPTIGAPAEGE